MPGSRQWMHGMRVAEAAKAVGTPQFLWLRTTKISDRALGHLAQARHALLPRVAHSG